jgi:uncharacterized membrane protein YeaQ/YmgE (transglycosylase-associated protein family)
VGGIASLIVPGRTPGGPSGAVVVGLLGGVLGGWLLNDLLGLGLGAGPLGAIVVGVGGTRRERQRLTGADRKRHALCPGRVRHPHGGAAGAVR